MSTKVSNSYLSSNPDINVSTREIANATVQNVAIVDASGNQITNFGGGGGGGGGNTAVSSATTQAIVSVTTSNTSILSSNSSRVGGWVKNISDEDIYISFSGTAATNKPTKIRPDASLTLSGDGWVYQGAVAAIHAGTGSKSVEVVEL